MKSSSLAFVVIFTLGLLSAISCADQPKPELENAAAGSVVMLPRVTWDKSGEAPAGLKPHTGGKITNIVIHHTETPNEAAEKAPGRIESIRNWHTKGRATPWKDIAYHYFIAPDGKIYEGRNSSFQTDTGAAYPLDGTLTVSLLGDYRNSLPTPAALDALVYFIRSKRAEHGLNASAISTHGKRAGGKTDCPGLKLQQWLDDSGMKQISQ